MNNIDWVRNESLQWVKDGIITPEQQEQITARYPASKTAGPLLVLFSIMGSLLIGAGIILVFATNWWQLPVAVKMLLAFLPLLAAQAVCLYAFRQKLHSTAFREGAALFLSLAFFAALALIGQIFHTPGDLESYLLVCILFSLPGIYLFRAKAAMAIYIAGAIFAGSSLPPGLLLVLTALILPFFYFELTKTAHKGALNYLLFLLCCMVVNTAIQVLLFGTHDISGLETALLCGMLLLLLDAAFRRIGSVYFFTVAKLLAIFCITVTAWIAATDFSYQDHLHTVGVVCAVVLSAVYVALRYTKFFGATSADLFAAAALLLLLAAPVAGAAATLLFMALGVWFIVRGSQTLTLRYLNFGMVLSTALLGLRFFDSSLQLLGRGIVFILLGAACLGANLFIAHKRKELQK